MIHADFLQYRFLSFFLFLVQARINQNIQTINKSGFQKLEKIWKELVRINFIYKFKNFSGLK